MKEAMGYTLMYIMIVICLALRSSSTPSSTMT